MLLKKFARVFFFTRLLVRGALVPYYGPPPSDLPNRKPLGFAANSTGGAGGLPNSTFIIDNMPDLRTALKLNYPKTIYVKGIIKGNDLYNNGTYADCQWYIDNSSSKNYNFTLYILSLNSTYTSLVSEAATAGELFEGRNASEYKMLLGRQNGWRGQAQNSQKAWEAIDMTSDTSLIGWDADATLYGVNLKLSSINNVHVRNLKIVPPKDCFPAPETYPATWNARYDAISSVTATNLWFDGNILQDGEKDVEPEPFINNWLVDKFDGLFDAEDGSDNITFSHNIIQNHHKSLLFGGGNKEADRDLGKMRFTIYGNHFNNSDSRNPLMRFGTFHILNNLFKSTNNKPPLFSNGTIENKARAIASSDIHPFQYHLGIYNQSKVLVTGNVFKQDGEYPDDLTRIFTYSDLTRDDIPATLCVRRDHGGFVDTFNGKNVALEEVSKAIFAYQVEAGKAVERGLLWNCDDFSKQIFVGRFSSAKEVEKYVLAEAGQGAPRNHKS